MKLPCPRCGAKETLGTFCKSCLRELHPLIEEIKIAKVTVCENCQRYKIQGKWAQTLTPALEHSLKVSDQARIDSVEFGVPELELKPGINKTTPVHAQVTGRNEEAPENYTEEYEVPLNYLVTLCENCKKQGTTYYEGILQVRNESEQSRLFIQKYLQHHLTKGTHLTKMQEQAGGTDYYLSNNRAVGHLARQLHKEFGGELKVAAQHFSESKQEGRILYRTNALVDLPMYHKGSIIRMDDEILHVIGISHKVTAESLKDHSERTFDYHKEDATVLPMIKARVVQSHPLTVLHPQTYQPIEPIKSKYAPAEVDVDSEVNVAVDGEKLYLPLQI